MSRDEDVVTVVGRKILVHARGEPARRIAYALDAGGMMVATMVAYGGYKYGSKLIEWTKGVSRERD